LRSLLALVCLLLAAPCWAQIAYNTPASATYKPLDGAAVSGKIHVQLQQTTGAPWTFSLDGVDKKPENTAPYVMANEAADSGDTNLWDTATSADGKHVVTAKNATQTLTASFTIANAPAPSPPTNPTPTGSGTTVVVSWNPPTTWDDGTPLTSLSGYRIYFGMARDALTAFIPVAGNVTSGSVGPLSCGTWYFAVTSLTSDGAESVDSAIVSRVLAGDTTPPPPPPPPEVWVVSSSSSTTRPVYEAVLPLTGTVLVRGNQEGTVPIGKPCGPELFKQSTNSYRAITEADATLASPTYRGRQHAALCTRKQ